MTREGVAGRAARSELGVAAEVESISLSQMRASISIPRIQLPRYPRLPARTPQLTTGSLSCMMRL
jgi:hypothetical protein